MSHGIVWCCSDGCKLAHPDIEDLAHLGADKAEAEEKLDELHRVASVWQSLSPSERSRIYRILGDAGDVCDRLASVRAIEALEALQELDIPVAPVR